MGDVVYHASPDIFSFSAPYRDPLRTLSDMNILLVPRGVCQVCDVALARSLEFVVSTSAVQGLVEIDAEIVGTGIVFEECRCPRSSAF